MTATSPRVAAIAAKPGRPWLHSVFGIVCVLSILGVRLNGGIPFGFGYDPNREHCMTDFHLGFYVLNHPTEIARTEIVMFPPVPALSYVHDAYIAKRVAAVPGDHLVIKDGVVSVNGQEVVRGLALAGVYKRTPKEFERDETVPRGRLFVVGNHADSDDSRYWGYLDASKVAGIVHKLF